MKWNIYVSFWTLVVQMFYREWILMFPHSKKWVYLYHLWLNFYCTSLCELHELWLLFYVLWIFHFLYYMQYIKVMSICNIPNDIFFSKKCSYYETTILSVMIHYCTYSITKTLHLDLLVQTWVTRSQTVVCFHHASLSMTCMITVVNVLVGGEWFYFSFYKWLIL